MPLKTHKTRKFVWIQTSKKMREKRENEDIPQEIEREGEENGRRWLLAGGRRRRLAGVKWSAWWERKSVGEAWLRVEMGERVECWSLKVKWGRFAIQES